MGQARPREVPAGGAERAPARRDESPSGEAAPRAAVAAILETGGSRVAGWGVGDAEPYLEAREGLVSRVAAGMHAGMPFTFRDPERSTDPRASWPWAERVITVAWSYIDDAGNPPPHRPGCGVVARFATEDHYAGLRALLGEVAAFLRSTGARAEVVVDDSRLVDRAAAVRAGVGWWGKNTMVLRPGVGPWFLIGNVVTSAILPTDAPMVRDCGTCTACLPACPTDALVAPGVLDARRCLAYLLQAPGDIPVEFRAAVGTRFYGCDDCLDACPPGRRRIEAAPRRSAAVVDLVTVLQLDDEELLARYGHFFIPRRRPNYLRRNALVALGNGGDPAMRTVIEAFVDDPDPMLRDHAAWALARLATVAQGGAAQEAAGPGLP